MRFSRGQVPSQNLEQRSLSLLEISLVLPSGILTLEALLIFALSFSFPQTGLLWVLVMGAIGVALMSSFVLFLLTGRSVLRVDVSLPESCQAVLSFVGAFLALVSIILFPLSTSVGSIFLAVAGTICCVAAVVCVSLSLLLGGFSLPDVPLFW